MPLRPAPGEKLQVVLGGDGIDVTGQLVAENQPAEFDYHYADNYRRPGGRGSNRRKLWPPSLSYWRKGWPAIPGGVRGRGELISLRLHAWFVKPDPCTAIF